MRLVNLLHCAALCWAALACAAAPAAEPAPAGKVPAPADPGRSDPCVAVQQYAQDAKGRPADIAFALYALDARRACPCGAFSTAARPLAR